MVQMHLTKFQMHFLTQELMTFTAVLNGENRPMLEIKNLNSYKQHVSQDGNHL